MHLTWLDNNSWLIEVGSQRILLDPWLVGSLTFGNLDWLFKGTLPYNTPIPENIDLILLSQGLPDHAHPPTLQQLNRQIPVVSSPGAAKVARELGYTSVSSLTPGETFKLHDQVEIQATPGSITGPNSVENGYLITGWESGLRLYYEPHGTHSPQIKKFAPVDVIITPLIDLVLPVVGSIIKGNNTALEVVKWLQPQVILPTADRQNAVFEGLVMKLLKAEGSIEEFRALLEKNNFSTQVIQPIPGERLDLPLHKRVSSL